MTNPVLLFASTTGYQVRQFAYEARKSGLSVTLATDRCRVLDDPWQDRAIPVRFHDPDTSVGQICQSGPYSGVIALGDRPAALAARAAVALGLPFHPPKSVDACHDKFLLRTSLAAAGLPVPAFFRAPASGNASEFAPRAPYPCVLKPLALSASQGVIRADSPYEFVQAFERIRALLGNAEMRVKRDPALDYIQVEEYIPGDEFAIEALATEGRVRVLAVFDKPDPLCGPYFEESIYVTPSRSPRVQEVVDAFESGVRALGLEHGPLHGEVRLNDEGAWILEIAPRPIGGLCAKTLRFQNGDGLEGFLLRHAAGEDVRDIHLLPGASGVMMIPVPRTGVYSGVDGSADAAQVPGIEAVDITAKESQMMLRWPEGSSYLGFLFSRAKHPADAEQALRDAHACLRFRFFESLPVAR